MLEAFIVPFLLVAFVLLYVFPSSTKDYFAWEVHPDMTVLIMGAGYIAGAYFFVRVLSSSASTGSTSYVFVLGLGGLLAGLLALELYMRRSASVSAPVSSPASPSSG